MSDSVSVLRTARECYRDLPEEFAPTTASQAQIKRQIALYIEAAALKPLLSRGIASEQVAEALIELALQGVQRSGGRVAAALLLQRMTLQAFRPVGADHSSLVAAGTAT